MSAKDILLISKAMKVGAPIRVTVSSGEDSELQISITIEDFLKNLEVEIGTKFIEALADKAGNPATLVTNAGLRARLLEANDKTDLQTIISNASTVVIAKIKSEMKRVF